MIVDFYFDVVCPYAYFAHALVPGLALRTGADVRWKPVLLGGILRAVGSPDDPNRTFSESRARYQEKDLARWADFHGLPLVRPPNHPRRTVLAQRAILASPDVARAARALYGAYWAEGRDLEDPSVVAAALSAAGLDGDDLVRRAPEQKDALRAATDEAVRAGAFGVPTFVVHAPSGPELFWGQDRIELVESLVRAA